MSRRKFLVFFVLLFSSAVPGLFSRSATADEPADDAKRLSIDRIYKGSEFNGKSFGGRWLDSNPAYTTLESSKRLEGGQDIVWHDAASGETRIMVDASQLVPAGEEKPLRVEGYSWSKDHNLLLIFTNTRRVWRNNTRGDYWLLDRTSRQLRKLGGDAPPSTLMFAKLSPNGRQVAYVHDRNLYVEDLLDHTVRQLTASESDDVINGTTDWVYEEELGLRDAFRWSPDGRSIAYWQINTEGVQRFPLVNQTDSLYPTIRWFAYPKVGQRNPTCRLGLVNIKTAQTSWIELPPLVTDHETGDPATAPDLAKAQEYYVPRMEFLPPAGPDDQDPRLLIQQLNRLQNTNRLLLADSRSGTVSHILTETDDAWVDVHDELKWIDDGQRFTWISDRDGWRHVYLASLDGGQPKLVTRGEFDVVELVKVDEPSETIFFIASPKSASERYLYRVGFDGGGLDRITPVTFPGVHSYRISSDAQWAIHTRSSANRPPVTNLVSMQDHRVVRVLEKNESLIATVEALDLSPVEFFRVDIGGNVELDAWCIRPPDFDPDKKYPLLVYVYGEPAGSTVINRWGGKSYLWHAMLAQQGYVVMSFDNRGTKAPRGRAWRKSIYKKIGILPPKDQANAVKAVLEQRDYIDPKRVGIWGWSGGGSSSLQAVFKYPKLYRAAIAVAPVPNQRYYDTIYQERYMSLPELNVEGFRNGSAINFAKNLEGKLLLVHGTGDDNCHYATTEMLIDELIAHNKQFSLMVYPNRSHSIRERKNTTRHLRSMMTDFLLQNL